MSRQAVVDFINAATSDLTLRNAIRESVDNIVAVAAANNFHFTRKEFALVLRDKWVLISDAAPRFCGCYVCYPPEDLPPDYSDVYKPKPPKPGRPKPGKPGRKPSAPAKKPSRKSKK
jgi:hypothetical protein